MAVAVAVGMIILWGVFVIRAIPFSIVPVPMVPRVLSGTMSTTVTVAVAMAVAVIVTTAMSMSTCTRAAVVAVSFFIVREATRASHAMGVAMAMTMAMTMRMAVCVRILVHI